LAYTEKRNKELEDEAKFDPKKERENFKANKNIVGKKFQKI